MKNMTRRDFMKKMMAGSIAAVSVALLAACGSGSDATSSGEAAPSASSERGTITVNIGRQTTANPKFPDGDSYEDNAYIRMVEAELDVQIVDAFEAESGDDYDRQVALALSSGSLPDMMMVGSKEELTELYENELIADLTSVYEEYASDYIKERYDSYDGRTLEGVTYDGKIMAIPGTNSDAGTSMLWVRADWVETLGLTVDADGDRCLTIEEVKELAQAFLQENPEDASNPVGLAFMDTLTSSSSDQTHSINAISYALGAYPRLWYYDESGELIYGSTTEEMKETLTLIKEWYEEGIVDPQLGTRTWDDITSLLTNGQCGLLFGSWHVADWLLNNVYTLNENAEFTPYAVINDDGLVNCAHCNANSSYLVVSADFAYPEIAIEILNLIYDDMVNSEELLEEYPEVSDYLNEGVDGTARPYNMEVKSNTYLLDEYAELKAALDDIASREDISTAEERANYDSITAYYEGNGDVTGWCKIHSRTKGVDLLSYLTENDLYNWLSPIYPETTDTMDLRWSNLQTLEEESFIKIITGTGSVEEEFDTFVSSWYAQGGETIIAEIEEQLAE